MSTSTNSENSENPVAAAAPGQEANAEETPAESRGDSYLDWFERYLIAGFYCWFVVRFLNNYLDNGDVTNLLMILSEGLVLVFILIRRPSRSMARQPLAWLIAFGAGLVPLLTAPGRAPNVPVLYLGGVALTLGILIQVHAKISLGRSFGCVPAHRGLKLGGPYRFVRHPMYTGYLISYLGILCANPNWWNLALFGICLGLMIPRLLLEERLLSTDPLYREYQAVVPYRLIPGVF